MSETDLRYLEGGAAIAGRIRALSGRVPNSAQVAFASSCLLHGRLFWDSAKDAPLETKPLLLYYGAAAFAKALVLAMKGSRPQDLSQSHGLSCSAGNADLIANFMIKANGRGVFQEFNDVVAPLNRLQYFEESSSRTRALPTASSDRLSSFAVTLVDCFARIPGVEKAYQLSTGANPLQTHLYFSDAAHEAPDLWTIRIDVPTLFDGLEALREVVHDVRVKAPFLSQWRIREASRAWDNTILIFTNRAVPANELEQLQGGPLRFEWNAAQNSDLFDAFESIPPLAGGYSRSAAGVAYIEPVGGENVSEYSLMLAALLGLSSLVRYHPHTWTACVHRRRISDRAVDDTLLPVIGVFLDTVQSRFPQFIADAMLGR